MSNILPLLAHALWIGGLALLLASHSYLDWQQEQGAGNAMLPLHLLGRVALLLCSLGFLTLSTSWLERGGWGVILLFLLLPLLRRGAGRA